MNALLRHWRRLLALIPIVLGLGVARWAMTHRSTPQPQEIEERARNLTVTPIERRTVTPRVVGYGYAQPARTWRAIARVSGSVLEVHPSLEAGERVGAGELLVRIDPTDYQIEVDRLAAEVESLEAQIEEALATRENDQESLKIEEESLDLVERELSRTEGLAKRQAASPSELDAQRRQVLQQRRQVQTLRNSLNVLPARIAGLRASAKSARQRLERARRDLQWTEIRAPFDARLASVAIEPDQYVTASSTLFEVHGTDSVEVEARLPLDEVRRLVSEDLPSSEAVGPPELLVGLQATVRVRSGDYARQWPAELVRIREAVDRRTRTMGIIVRVRHPSGAGGPALPPLLDGTFCEVTFSGKPRPDRLVVPLTAVRNGSIFVLDDQNRLRRREVQQTLWVGDEAVIEGDLTEGTPVVVSDPTPAVEGQLVEPTRLDAADDAVRRTSEADESVSDEGVAR